MKYLIMVTTSDGGFFGSCYSYYMASGETTQKLTKEFVEKYGWERRSRVVEEVRRANSKSKKSQYYLVEVDENFNIKETYESFPNFV